MKDFFGIHSPSRVFSEIGKLLIDGFIQGINGESSEVENTMHQLSTLVTETMNALFSNIDDISEPTIRPVLDASEVANGIGDMFKLFSKVSSSKLFGDWTIAHESMASADSAKENQNGSGSKYLTAGSTYSFVQNNYSPKALSKSEIYRQTRNQFSMLKGGS